MAYERSGSTQDNFGKFIYQLQPETKTLVWKLERILIKLHRQNVCLLFIQLYVCVWVIIIKSHWQHIVPWLSYLFAQSAGGVVEYTDCFSAEGYDHPIHSECPEYDTKSDGEVPVILEHWGMWSTLFMPSLPGLLWPGVVAPDRVLCMGQIELNCILMLNWIVWK